LSQNRWWINILLCPINWGLFSNRWINNHLCPINGGLFSNSGKFSLGN